MADLNEAMLGTVGNTDDDRKFHKSCQSNFSTVDSRYSKLLGPSEITLLYRKFVMSGLQKQ